VAGAGVVVAVREGGIGALGGVAEAPDGDGTGVAPVRGRPWGAPERLSGVGRGGLPSGRGRVERGGADTRSRSDVLSSVVSLVPLGSGAGRAMPSGENHFALSGVRLVDPGPAARTEAVGLSLEAVVEPEPVRDDVPFVGRSLIATVFGREPEAGWAASRLAPTSFVLLC
jgi:hypothetical protein